MFLQVALISRMHWAQVKAVGTVTVHSGTIEGTVSVCGSLIGPEGNRLCVWLSDWSVRGTVSVCGSLIGL